MVIQAWSRVSHRVEQATQDRHLAIHQVVRAIQARRQLSRRVEQATQDVPQVLRRVEQAILGRSPVIRPDELAIQVLPQAPRRVYLAIRAHHQVIHRVEPLRALLAIPLDGLATPVLHRADRQDALLRRVTRQDA